jgi:dihydroorotate dehydrogenase
LETLISGVLAARDNLNLQHKTPILLKIAPDLNQQDLADVADVVLNNPKVN